MNCIKSDFGNSCCFDSSCCFISCSRLLASLKLPEDKYLPGEERIISTNTQNINIIYAKGEGVQNWRIVQHN